jgi:hypothetical protein
MGSFCSNDKKIKKESTINNSENTNLNLKHKETYIYTDADKKNVISFNQSTFIREKKYSEFSKDYNILSFLGKGN